MNEQTTGAQTSRSTGEHSTRSSEDSVEDLVKAILPPSDVLLPIVDDPLSPEEIRDWLEYLDSVEARRGPRQWVSEMREELLAALRDE